MNVVTYESEFTRPDLAVPLFPLPGFPSLMRRHLLGLRGPNFAGAYRVTLAAAWAGFAVAAASLLVSPPWQEVVVYCSALIGLYVIARALALVAFERRQHTFEREWLAAQSEVLRGHAFEVLRFTVQDLIDEDQGVRQTYDLTRPADVRDLFRRQARERNSPWWSRATVELTYVSRDGTLAVAEVHRGLPELTFLEGWARPGRAWVRFPGARYLGRPRGGRRPAQRTHWALSGPVVIAVSESAYGGAAGPAQAPKAPAQSSGLGPAR
ncbi:MAG TPA: hypothetical protein VLW50_03930 [Streptosporangiaceae bacterium]|nr:hypothetical protein [Streptosporangiaceae bacterium]